MARSLSHSPRRLCRHDGGNVIIEFALALPILSLMLVGMLDLGRFAIDKATLLQAARAGAQYGVAASQASTNPAAALSATDLANVSTTAQNSTTLSGVTVTNSLFCECSSGVSVSCSSTCSSGGTLKNYLTVTTTRAFSSVVGATGISFGTAGSWTAPTSVTASVTMILP
jgi:Flp pilus assembly protein TadG